MTQNDIILRKATRKDAAHLALLEDMASHGLSSWLWYGALKRKNAETVFDWGRQRMLMDQEPTSYVNGVIAENSEDICGMAIGYDLPSTTPDSAFESEVDVLKPIMKLFREARGTWLIDSLVCYPEYRRQGIGQVLISDQINRAQQANHSAISLIAEDTNGPAVRLYEKNGFQFRQSEKTVPFSPRNTANEYHLMIAAI